MSARADKALADLYQQNRNWSRQDFERILRGLGFVREKKKRKHTWIYRHPEHPDLKMGIPDHDSLKPVYAKKLRALTDIIKERENLRSD